LGEAGLAPTAQKEQLKKGFHFRRKDMSKAKFAKFILAAAASTISAFAVDGTTLISSQAALPFNITQTGSLQAIGQPVAERCHSHRDLGEQCHARPQRLRD
jgi:hypothetical protein